MRTDLVPSESTPTHPRSSSSWIPGYPQSLSCFALLALASALAAPIADAQQFFLTTTSCGDLVIEVDIPMSPETLKIVTESGTLIIDDPNDGSNPICVISHHRSADIDPYFAARLRVTNVDSVARRVGMSLVLQMLPVLTPTTPPSTFTGAVSVTLSDTSGNGLASYTGSGAGFALSHVIGASLTPSHSVSLAAPGSVVVYDVPPTPVPVSFTGRWTRVEFAHLGSSPVGSLSSGDTVEFYVFGCVATPSTPCPAPPELPLPEPTLAASLGTSLAFFAALASRPGRSRLRRRQWA